MKTQSLIACSILAAGASAYRVPLKRTYLNKPNHKLGDSSYDDYSESDEVELSNLHNVAYTGPFYFPSSDTDSDNQQFVYATGINASFVVSKDCKGCDLKHGYDPTKGSEVNGDTVTFNWGAISADAILYEDEACLSNSDPNICTGDDYEFWNIQSFTNGYDSSMGSVFYGMVGFGYNSNMTEVNTDLIASINNQNNGVNQIVTWSMIKADMGDSEVYIGEGAGSSYKGHAIDIGPANCSGWSVPVTGMGYGGANVYDVPGLDSCGLLQTEYPFLGVSTETFDMIGAVVSQFNYTYKCDDSEAQGLCYAKDTTCEPLIEALPDIQFEINSHNYSIPPANYLESYTYSDGSEICVFALNKTDYQTDASSNYSTNGVLLGQPFFRTFVIQMDYSNAQVSILHLKSDDKTMSPGDIVLICLACVVFTLGVGCCTWACYRKRQSKEAHYATLYDKATEGGEEIE